MNWKKDKKQQGRRRRRANNYLLLILTLEGEGRTPGASASMPQVLKLEVNSPGGPWAKPQAYTDTRSCVEDM
jgi:hypothetical protein